MPPGPAGQTGFPGSTSSTRTFGKSTPPRSVKLRVDTLGGANNGLGTTPEVRQSSYRGDVPGANIRSPRETPIVVSPQTAIRQSMQHNDTEREFFGGPELKTGVGNNTAGANPGWRSAAAGGHDVRDTETPMVARQPVIGVGTPGAQNVRNQVSQRYKNPAGQTHSYKSAPNPGKPATDVSVPNRFVFPGGGNQTWSALREMPYGGRGNGARGADLNGQRYYAAGQADQFWNAGQGDLGIARERGNKRPVSFTQPAPWASNFYDTTDSVGTTDSPGTSTQVPQSVYYSPSAGRASNTTGRS